jgi:hypothetical protein
MRKSGHKMDAEALRDSLASKEESFKESATRQEKATNARDASFFMRWAKNSLDYARLAYLFDTPVTDIREILRTGIGRLQTAVEFGGALIPALAPLYLAGALIAEEDSLTKWIARLPKKSYTHPDVQAGPSTYAYMAALQSLTIANNRKSSATVAEFQSLLVPEKLNNPKATLPRLAPIAGMLGALTERSQDAFDRSWKERFSYWKKTYNKASEIANYDGILDIEGLGIATLARRDGLKIPGDSPYIPLEMLPSTS